MLAIPRRSNMERSASVFPNQDCCVRLQVYGVSASIFCQWRNLSMYGKQFIMLRHFQITINVTCLKWALFKFQFNTIHSKEWNNKFKLLSRVQISVVPLRNIYVVNYFIFMLSFKQMLHVTGQNKLYRRIKKQVI